MKDARKDLIPEAGLKSPDFLSGIPCAGPTRFTSPLAVQSDRLSCRGFYHRFGVFVSLSYAVYGATGSDLKSSPYFRIAQAILAFFAAIATAARQ
jgi:hypothetical protein